MNKERNISIDIIKGIGIILMVGGHCGMPFTHFIYLFHMAIFFMASGYCFNASNSETMQDVLSFVKRKFIVRAWSLVGNVYVCGDYCSSAFKRDVEKIEREIGEKIFSGEING